MIEKKRYQKIVLFILPAIISMVIAGIAMNIWTIDFEIIRFPESDERLGLMMFKNIKENGFIGAFFNNRIGAPERSALLESPFLDWPMVLAIWFLTRFLNYNVAYYVFYILTFVTASLSMYLLLRKICNKYWICACISISYAITPYHFYRSVVHMTLSNYYVIPLGVYLVLLVYEEEWEKGIPSCIKNNTFKKMFFLTGIVLVSLSNVYYAFFVMLLVLITIIYKMIEKKTWKPLINEALIFYAMCILFIGGLLPKLIYGQIHGINTVAGIRNPSETETYGLKIIQLFLPPEYSKIQFLTDINKQYTDNAILINENSWSNMGIIACIGFIVLCIWFLVNHIKPFKGSKETARFKLFTVLTLVILLFCTVGGFGTIFSYVITPELRCLNRGSIVLVTISLTFLAGILIEIKQPIAQRLSCIALTVLLVFSIYAEVDYLPYNWSKESEQLSNSYLKFFRLVESEMNEGDMIYQLPIMYFPESSPIYNMDDYSHLIAYLYTDTLKWSYGGMKGRNVTATDLYIDDGMSENFLLNIKKMGFSGLYIDSYGYKDDGNEIIQFYKDILNKEPIVSDDGRLYFFKI